MHEDQPKGETFDCHWHERYVEKDAELARCENGLNEWKVRAEKAEQRLQVGLALVRDATSDAEETEARAERLTETLRKIETIAVESFMPDGRVREAEVMAVAIIDMARAALADAPDRTEPEREGAGEYCWLVPRDIPQGATLRVRIVEGQPCVDVFESDLEREEAGVDAADADDAASKEWYG